MELENSVVFIIVGFVFVYQVLRRLNGWYYAAKLGQKWPNLPPGHMGWPLLGSTLSFANYATTCRFHNFLNTFFTARYGKGGMYKTHILGNATIIVSTPELIRQVLTDEESFLPRLPLKQKLLTGRKSLLLVTRSEHRRLRRLSTAPVSGHKALEMYISHIEQTVMIYLEEWASMIKSKPIELLTEMKKLTFEIIWNIFMGSSSVESSFGELEALFTHVIAGFLSLPINIPGFKFNTALKARKHLLEIFQSILIEKRLVKEKQGGSWEAKDAMDMLMEIKGEDGEELDDESIKDLIFGKLFAGHETSAFTAMWAIIHLTNHSDVFQKAKEEQEDIIRRRPTTQKGLILSEIKQMKYLYQVIDETLRVSCITPMLFREAVVDIEINGKLIPKGWKVITWFAELYMDEKYFPCPHEFNPSRWDNFVATPGAFIPFGLGSRTCPGSDLARLEISIFLHYFLLNYKVEQVNPNCELTRKLFPYPKDNCLARVFKVE